jgi:predicted dehydrogenase
VTSFPASSPPRPDPAFRVGIVGTGFIARQAHIPAWNALPGARVTALCDIDPESLEAAGREAPGAARFADYRALLEADVDAVAICTSNAAHFPVALAALLAGKHVLCEKPLGISAAEAGSLGEVADARGLVLMAQHQLRFAGPALAARACVRAGKVGTVHHARARALRRDRVPTSPGLIERDLAGGGAVLDLGVHALDLALWLMDFPRAVRVSGSVRTNFARGTRIAGHWGEWDRSRFSVEDFGTGLVHFENGATLMLECAWVGHHGEDGLDCELFGEAGNLRWPSGELFSQGASFTREALAPPVAEEPHAAAIRAFHRAATEGGESPVPWREARASLAILEALYASARDGREVLIEPAP